ncbi:hypothetical protein PHPALM_28640 [Phytophthora palmivora]|uniref:Uncharacterized protein n=1 Tax=Phytophthora palmivora TaxID=4796 RepID=A0A2P4X9J9_9STRA|nr:hypothetical protein PHPALM_28640 [Phytophthora palmivora]
MRIVVGQNETKSARCEVLGSVDGDPVIAVPVEPPDLVSGELVGKFAIEQPKDKENATGFRSHGRVFRPSELDAMEEGQSNGVIEEVEEYEKELEERLFPIDEVELKRRIKMNEEKQEELTLTELSTLLETAVEVLTRTRDSSTGALSTPDYWIDRYHQTLVSSEAARRANHDF